MEEFWNAATHGIGTALATVGLIFLLFSAHVHGSIWHVVSFSIYGVSLVLLYLASTLYHSFRRPKLKHVFHIVDHAAIYLLIAGTYTPFALVILHGIVGWAVMGIIWTLAAVGIVLKVFFIGRFKAVSTACYIGMGWLIVLCIKPLAAGLAANGLYWLLAGGALYTVGAVFYLLKKMPYNHTVWHLFVLGGSAAHFVTIAFYVLPTATL